MDEREFEFDEGEMRKYGLKKTIFFHKLIQMDFETQRETNLFLCLSR
jgi:hypothetical protein